MNKRDEQRAIVLGQVGAGVLGIAAGTTWHLADLASVQLARSFDAIVMAGNVTIFLTPGSERAVVENMAHHLREDGLLVAGFQISAGRLSLQRYDEIAADAGLTLSERWSTWSRDEWNDGHAYAVSVHRRQCGASSPDRFRPQD